MTLTGMIRNNQKDILFIFKKLINSCKINRYEQDIKFKKIAKSVQSKLIQIMNDVECNKHIYVFDSIGYYLHALNYVYIFYINIKILD